MEGPESAGAVDEDYMTMDAEQWADNADIYKNGDTLDIESGRKKNLRTQEPGHDLEGRKKEAKKGRDAANRAIFAQPLPDRYMTIRYPAPNANRGAGRRDQLAFFRFTTVGLVVLCLLLIGALVSLSFVYNKLTGIKENVNVNITVLNLIEKDDAKLINDTEALINISVSVYHIAITTYPDCLSEEDLFIANPLEFEEYIQQDSFLLNSTSMADNSCYTQYYWNCTC